MIFLPFSRNFRSSLKQGLKGYESFAERTLERTLSTQLGPYGYGRPWVALSDHVPASLGLESKGKVGGNGEGAMVHRFRGSNWVGIDRREVPHGGQERRFHEEQRWRRTEDSGEDDSGGETGGALVQKLHKKEGKLVSSSTEIEEQQREGRTAEGSPE